eukprot:m.303891 g.303891  ORF g.303891 m.303891 type:complete len:226 (+) comp15894_c0_seq16:2219-2896(+)
MDVCLLEVGVLAAWNIARFKLFTGMGHEGFYTLAFMTEVAGSLVYLFLHGIVFARVVSRLGTHNTKTNAARLGTVTALWVLGFVLLAFGLGMHSLANAADHKENTGKATSAASETGLFLYETHEWLSHNLDVAGHWLVWLAMGTTANKSMDTFGILSFVVAMLHGVSVGTIVIGLQAHTNMLIGAVITILNTVPCTYFRLFWGATLGTIICLLVTSSTVGKSTLS